MSIYATPTSPGVWQTFVTLAAIYFAFMVAGALGYRVPPQGWAPEGFTPPAAGKNGMMTHRHVHLDVAWQTPQFWLLWGVLCLNVSAGIGVLGMASPMLQEVFGGRLLGLDVGFDQLDSDQKKQIAAIAAGFTGLLSLCNIGGRLGWASASDKFGRKLTYAIFFVAGLALYSAIPFAAKGGMVGVFVLLFAIIISMYGGGFSTIPAYLADVFGTHHVGAIHGRLLTAWSTAGVLGPALVNYIREYQLSVGVPRAAAYNQTMYVLAGLLLLGLICNLLVRRCADRYYMSDEEVAAQKHVTVAEIVKVEDDIHADFEDFVEEAAEPSVTDADPPSAPRVRPVSNGGSLTLVLAWGAVGVPLAWGVCMTLLKTAALFH